jgi:perosamine synthetase
MIGSGHIVVTDDDISAVASALVRRQLGGGAEIVTEYESELARFFGVTYAVACSSGTAAITIALKAAGAGGGAEVLVPATAPVMTSLAILAAGATPVFVDVDEHVPFAPDLADAELCLRPATAAVLTVPMWGYAGAEPTVAAWASERGLLHVEDAAQAHGSTVNGQLVGTIGAVGCFSTHARKLVATGEGGFCLTAAAELAEGMRAVRQFGLGDGGFGVVDGINAKLAGVLAALGITQLGRLRERLFARRRILAAWREALDALPDVAVLDPGSGAEINAYALVLRARSAAVRDEVEAVFAQCGIESDAGRYSYAPAYRRPVLRDYARDCPRAEELCATVCTVPTHEGVDMVLIAEASERLRSR